MSQYSKIIDHISFSPLLIIPSPTHVLMSMVFLNRKIAVRKVMVDWRNLCENLYKHNYLENLLRREYLIIMPALLPPLLLPPPLIKLMHVFYFSMNPSCRNDLD